MRLLRVLTPTGRAVLLAGLLLWATGVLLGYPELLVLAAAALLAVLLGAVAVVVRPRTSVTRTVAPGRVEVGGTALGRVVVRNLGRLPAPGLRVVDRVDGTRLPLSVPPLAPGAVRELALPVHAPRRGRLALGPVTVERTDPLGLLRREQPQGQRAVLWVHPVVHTVPTLPVGVLLDQEGPLREQAPRGGSSFSSLREYVAGDDPRLVHWPSSARTGTLMVKEQVDTSRPTTTVVLDTRGAAMPPASFEVACEVAASVATAVERAGRPVSLLLLGEDRAAVADLGASTLLDRLAAVGQVADPDPSSLITLLERADSGGTLVVVTGDDEPATAARLSAQRRRFAPVVVVAVSADADLETSRRAGSLLLRGSTGADLAAGWSTLVLGRRR